MSKLEELIESARINELINKKEEEKPKKTILWILAVIGAVAAVAAVLCVRVLLHRIDCVFQPQQW